MGKIFWSIVIFVEIFFASCTSISTSIPTTKFSKSPNSESLIKRKIDFNKFINSSYIRTNFYEIGRIYDESLLTCNDIIYLVSNPYSNGSLYFEIPENSFKLTDNVSWLAEYKGKNGVIALNGTSQIDAKKDILNKASGELNQFTFATWLYLDEWKSNSYLFKKEHMTDNDIKVAFQLGPELGDLVFTVNNTIASTYTFKSSKLTLHNWHHIALVHKTKNNESKTQVYIDGILADEINTILSLPCMNDYYHLYLGSNIKGKIDETFFSVLPMSQDEIVRLQTADGLNFNNWNHTKIQAYWKYDDKNNPGKDEHSWVSIMKGIRQKLAGQNIKFRLGISGGEWKKMIQDTAYRTNFANQVKATLDQYQFDGVDFDFEWPSASEFTDYSETIKEVRKTIGSDYLLSVSLHPIAFRLTPDAIDACSWISYQCYGPKGKVFPYEVYVENMQKALKYGIPSKKLIAGLPFYGTKNWDKGNANGTVSYYDMVKDKAITKRNQDSLPNYKDAKYWLNSYQTIQKKVRFAITKNLRGVMSWDLATDCDFTNDLSLQRATVEEILKFTKGNTQK